MYYYIYNSLNKQYLQVSDKHDRLFNNFSALMSDSATDKKIYKKNTI